MNAKAIMLSVLTCLTLTFACQAKEPASKENHAIQHMTKNLFLSNVWNYETTPETWQYQGKRPCIIDFYADWCGPCRMLSPILEEIAQEYAGKLDVYKINVDQERDLSSAFGVTSIPMLLFCPMEGTPQVVKGFMKKEELKQAIKEVLKL